MHTLINWQAGGQKSIQMNVSANKRMPGTITKNLTRPVELEMFMYCLAYARN